jgi:hypothetical protein
MKSFNNIFTSVFVNFALAQAPFAIHSLSAANHPVYPRVGAQDRGHILATFRPTSLRKPQTEEARRRQRSPTGRLPRRRSRDAAGGSTDRPDTAAPARTSEDLRYRTCVDVNRNVSPHAHTSTPSSNH